MQFTIWRLLHWQDFANVGQQLKTVFSREANMPFRNDINEWSYRSIKQIAKRKPGVPSRRHYTSITWQYPQYNLLYPYEVWVKNIDKTFSWKPESKHEAYKKGKSMLVRNWHSRCTIRYKTRKVTGVLCTQVVLVDWVTYHVKDYPLSYLCESTNGKATE